MEVKCAACGRRPSERIGSLIIYHPIMKDKQISVVATDPCSNHVHDLADSLVDERATKTTDLGVSFSLEELEKRQRARKYPHDGVVNVTEDKDKNRPLAGESCDQCRYNIRGACRRNPPAVIINGPWVESHFPAALWRCAEFYTIE